MTGTYYVQNATSGKYMAAGHSWGTQAIVNESGLDMTLSAGTDKKVTFESQVFNGDNNHFLGSNLYMDSPTAEWGLLEQDFGFYITDGTKYLSVDANDNLELSATPHLWLIVTPEGVKAQRLEDLEAASSENPMDATWLIQDANFNRGDDRKSAWTGDDFGVGGKETHTNAEKSGGNSQTFDIKQTIEAPNGLYKITWNGFNRYNNTTDNTNEVAVAAHADGTEVISSFVYINDKDYALTSIADDKASAALEGKLPFSQGDATNAFEAGLYEQEAEVTVTDGKLTIGIKKTEHPGTDWTVWDNFRLTYLGTASNPDEELAAAPEGWTLAVTNGNLAGDDLSSYVSKEAPSADILPARIVAGAGKDGSRGIVVQSADEVGKDGAQDWDSQFWIVLNEKLPQGTKLHVEFDYKASQAAKAATQAHGNPGSYQHWAAIGDVNFTTEWQHFSTDIEVSGDMATGQGGTGLLSIAFNLAVERTATEYCLDNFGVWYQKPAPVEEWKDIITNGTMEGTDVVNFFKTESTVGPVLAEISDGIGKDGGRAIKVQSGDSPSQNWDTQFFIRLPFELAAGTKFRISFDYKADKDAASETQSHNEPGQYIHWACVGSPSFTAEWQHYEYEGTVASQCDGTQDNGGYLKNFQTIAFNLALNKVATEFIFDNVKFEVEKSVWETGIRTVNATVKAADGAIYDLRGRKVEGALRKGVYIQNGRKIMVK